MKSVLHSFVAALPLVLIAGQACAQWTGPFGTENRIEYVTGNVYAGTAGFSNPLVRSDVVDMADTGRIITFHAFAGTPSPVVRTTAIWGETNNPAGRAVQGFNFATTGSGAGIWAETAANAGQGLRARATSTTGTAIAGYFDNASSAGVGAYAQVTDTTVSATPIAVWGDTQNATGYAAYFTGGRNYFQGNVGIGTATPAHPLTITATDNVTLLEANNASTAGNACGFTGTISSTTPGTFSAGVRGTNSSTTSAGVGVWGTHAGQGYGIYGAAFDTGGFAGYFNGAVSVNGMLSKTGGTFKIDHPLDPANKYLYHSFVESPDMMNIYNGNATTDTDGYATITMPDWFSALNTDFRYQLTVIDESDNDDMFIWAKVVRKMNNNTFTIRSSRGGVDVSWQVTGVRQDAWANAHRVVPEVAKESYNKGKYLHPELFGAPPSAIVDYLQASSATTPAGATGNGNAAKAKAPAAPLRKAPVSNEPPLKPAIGG